MVRINNNVTYQRVLELGEAKSKLPVGRPIAEAKGYNLPSAIIPSPPPATKEAIDSTRVDEAKDIKKKE